MAVPILLLLSIVVALVFIARSRELFRISIRAGEQTVERGYVPSGLLSDFAGVVRSVESGEIRARKAPDQVHLEFSGDIDEQTAQRLRNVFGLYPAARLRAPRGGKR